jgi:hypothetical protein
VVKLLTEKRGHPKLLESIVEKAELADKIGEREGHSCLESKILRSQLGTLTWFSKLLRENHCSRLC